MFSAQQQQQQQQQMQANNQLQLRHLLQVEVYSTSILFLYFECKNCSFA